MNTTLSAHMRNLAPIVLRIGLSLVVLWFGVEQIIDVRSWLGFLPAWTAALPISQTGIIYLNGAFEIIFGGCMLLGLYTRFVAIFLALHLFDITYVVGYDAIGVRDFGLAIGVASVFLFGDDTFSLDTFFKKP